MRIVSTMAQWDEAEWERQDAEFAAARTAVGQAAKRWRAAGGHRHVGGQIDALEEWRDVAIAKAHYNEISEMAFPPPFRTWLDGLRDGFDFVAPVLDWLERDPFCRHSGYWKQKAYRYLYKFEFTPEERTRLQDILIRSLSRGPRQGLRELAHLAKRIDSDRFRSNLAALKNHAVESGDQRLEIRAEVVLRSISRSGTASPPRIALSARPLGPTLGGPSQA